MFSIGEKVVYKTNAVCNVESIETPSFSKDAGKKYYKLKHLFSNGNEVVYVPVDSDVNIRKIISESAAKECFDLLKNKEVDEVQIKQPARLAEYYQTILSCGSIEASLTVLKEILIKEKKCAEQGKKLRQVEEHYLGIVEKAVTEELSVALGKEIDLIKEMIIKAVFGE